MDIEKLKYPIGEWQEPKAINTEGLRTWISTIADLPKKLTAVLKDMDNEKLEWIYRPEGWSIRQVVHHLADSHMNSFIRFKLALTEDLPTIRPYNEAKWAEMDDHLKTDVSASLLILEGVHLRWNVLLNAMNNEDFNRKYHHPESNREYTLAEATSLYAWHCKHHLAHLLQAMENEGKYSLAENL
ncbi:MAG: putative metal-dependent hydrolase [Flavobacteriales bacterium]|nr:putative metal-dependent hydrolase [Flavobacteriales bacterium]